jgi:2-octaprenyl-6-methoxyphenol hydroxylase
MPQMPATHVQMVIAGAGAVGLTLALALRQALGHSFHITVADPALARQPASSTPDHRAYALAAGARRMLEALGVWEQVAPHAEPIRTMAITDSRTRDVMRPVFLRFEEERPEGEPFAQIVLADALNAALAAAARARGITLCAQSVIRAVPAAGHMQVTLSGGDALRVPLLVAADGARSPLREAAGMGWVGHDYAQRGIVATLGHERPHGGQATEHFLPGGPFALLPLCDDAQGRHRSSMVWSEPAGNAAGLLALPEDAFLHEVEARSGLALGELELLDRPRDFPLRFGLARRFAKDRLVLVGDAAHSVHPIAGQGLNLGLKDVAVLAEIIADAARLGLDTGAATVLERYETARRADTVMMAVGMDTLNRLFSNDALPLRLARDFGLGIVERMPRLKSRFIAQAAGESGSPARLMRGQPL